MKRVLLFDTSVATLNMGDEIINRSIEANWPELFSSSYIMRMASHTPMHTPLQHLLYRRKLSQFKSADLKFLCGTNALYTNMLRPLPAWNIHYLNCGPASGTVCLGTGLGVNSRSVNRYTQALFRRVLARDVVHSVRDERTRRFLESIGLDAWNTGCPTLWGLTPEHCQQIPREKSAAVVFTLTSYHPDPVRDKAMISILRKHYSSVSFWPQCMSDLAYLRSLGETAGIDVVRPNIAAFQKVLDTRVDYVGNRLHGGIFAIQRGCRSIIISIDYRAREMGKDYALRLVERDSIATDLPGVIEGRWGTSIDGLDFDLIERWKAQFDVQE